MSNLSEFAVKGYTIIPDVYSDEEIKTLTSIIEAASQESELFRRTNDLFAIRQFFKEIPGAYPVLLNERLQTIIADNFGNGFIAVKSIYFDKPPDSNWFVAYHQDLTISVSEKHTVEGFGPWTVKKDQYAVQAPLDILRDNFTIRVHLDSANSENGALKIIKGSHLKGIYRPETIDWNIEQEITCEVEAGGIMIMKPLLLHASGRTTNHSRRRVVHIEFSRQQLPAPLQWSEIIDSPPKII